MGDSRRRSGVTARPPSLPQARHTGYSGRRVWRALSLFAPSLALPAHYNDMLVGAPPLPFSVKPDAALLRLVS